MIGSTPIICSQLILSDLWSLIHIFINNLWFQENTCSELNFWNPPKSTGQKFTSIWCSKDKRLCSKNGFERKILPFDWLWFENRVGFQYKLDTNTTLGMFICRWILKYSTNFPAYWETCWSARISLHKKTLKDCCKSVSTFDFCITCSNLNKW